MGEMYRPYLDILVRSNKVPKWFFIEVLVDTGADYTLFPKRHSELLRIDLKKDCQFNKTVGIGGNEGVYLCKDKVQMRVGNFEKIIPVGFLTRNDVPALLGRLQCLEILSLTMKNHTTILEK